MSNDPAQHERDRYLLEVLDTTLKTVERVTKRMDREAAEDRQTLDHLTHELKKIEHDLRHPAPPPNSNFATKISFKETTMLPVEAGNTLVYTGTLSPAGSILAPDAQVEVQSNDPAVVPTVDSTGLIVTVPLPAGWVENETTPLEITYATTSATTSQALSGTITPGAEVVLATGIAFQQTT
jgi:hypothetical protein